MRTTTGACVVLTLSVMTASIAMAQNVSDSTAPQISTITFGVTTADTTAGTQGIAVSVGATDDLSGVNYVYVYLQNTSNSQPYNTRTLSCYVTTLQSGSRTNGVFSGTCTFPQYSQSGTWFVHQVYVYDNVGNYRTYSNNGAQLSIAPQTISVTSPSAPPPSATVVPALLSISVTPGAVDTSNGSQTLTFTARLTSTGNYSYSYVSLRDPGSEQYIYVYFWASTRISGDVFDGVYQTTYSLPKYSRAGNWVWNHAFLVSTNSEYAQYYNASNGIFTYVVTFDGATSATTNLGTSGPPLSPENLVVTSNPSDTAGPTLVNFQLTPSSIDVAAQSAMVAVNVSATDALSGFSYGYVYFVSPNGQQFRGTSFYASSNGTGTINFPQYSQAGNWQLYYLYLVDFLGNATYVTSTYLFDHGFPNSIQISSGLKVANATGTVGGSVTLSAVLTNLGAPVPGKTIAFTVEGNSVGAAVTDSTGAATITNVSIASFSAGTYINAIGATFGGDGILAASSGQGTLTVTNKLSQTITFNAIADHPLTDSPITLSATASSGLPVSFVSAGNCTVSGSTVTLTAAGSCQIVASQSGDATYNPAQSVSRTFNVTNAGQTITFDPLSNRTYGDATFGLTASASSGLPVSFSLGTGSVGCAVNGTTVTITGAAAGGQSCIVVASQAGDGTYSAAPSVTRSFTIAKASQTISFAALPNRTFGDSAFGVNATATSGLSVNVAVGAGSVGCSLSGTTVTITAATSIGQSCSIIASQAGDANYNPASSVTRSFTIAKAAQAITFAGLPNKTYLDAPFTLSASAPGGTVSFALGAGSLGCALSGTTVTITGSTGAGQSCIIVASQAGSANYEVAPDVTQRFTIGKAAQTITFDGLPNKSYLDAPFTPSASAPGGAVSFALGAGSVGCAVSGTTVTITGATGAGQSCIVTASQAGSANYEAAPDVVRSFTIARAGQMVTFNSLTDKMYGDSPFTVSATASSNLPVEFTASGACVISGTTVTLTSGGICYVTAAQNGNGNYNPAPTVMREFDVAYNWSNVLQPINVDGTSIFKLGSTIPVKFQLTGASAAVTTLAARIYIAPITNAIVGSELEALSTSAADSGNTFRYDATSGQYVFNLGTRGLSQGTWQIRIDLLDAAAAPRTVLFSLRK